MPSLKEIRTRISTVRSTRKITSAMKMVAASRLRRVQNYIVHLRNYAHLLRYIVDEVMEYIPPGEQNVFMKKRDNRDVLLFVIGSNRGLCGTYNAFLIKEALHRIRVLQDDGYTVRIMAVGKKIRKYFDKREWELLPCDHQVIEKPSYASVSGFADLAVDMYLKHNVSRIDIIYNRFTNAVVRDMTCEQVLPLTKETLEQKKDTPPEKPVPQEKLILEPSPGDVLEHMTKQYIRYNFFRIFLDASASEHGSRMTAMHKATDNADDMIASLSLSYNKMRQASITRELFDIVGGAERNRF